MAKGNWRRIQLGLASLGVGLAATVSVCALSTQANLPDPNDRYIAKVLRVVDGETLMVQFLDNDGEPGGIPFNGIVKLELLGIDAPLEEQMRFSYFTGQYLQDRVNHQTIYVEFPEAQFDDSDSLSAYIWVGETMVNEEMLRLGHALIEEPSRDIRYGQEFSAAQELAQKRGLGIWNFYSPLRQTPAEFRQTLGG